MIHKYTNTPTGSVADATEPVGALTRGGRAGLRFVFEELIHEERRAIPHRKGIVLEPVAEDDETLVATQC